MVIIAFAVLDVGIISDWRESNFLQTLDPDVVVDTVTVAVGT